MTLCHSLSLLTLIKSHLPINWVISVIYVDWMLTNTGAGKAASEDISNFRKDLNNFSGNFLPDISPTHNPSHRVSCFVLVWFYLHLHIFRSTPKSLPNNIYMGLKCPYVRPSKKSFSDSDEIWYVGRGRWVMHDGMPYNPIQGQGYETFKVRNSLIFKIYLLRHF